MTLSAAASCYIEIILKESDNNVKLIVLDRLIALKEQPSQERVLQVINNDIDLNWMYFLFERWYYN